MDHAPRLTVVSSLHLPSMATKKKRGVVPARLFIISLMLNGGLALGAGAAALTLQARLERLTQNTQAYAQATQRYATGLERRNYQSLALADGLGDVRAAVSSHAREESLFLKRLILKPTPQSRAGAAHRERGAAGMPAHRARPEPGVVAHLGGVRLQPARGLARGRRGADAVLPVWKKVLELDDLTGPERSIHAGVQILQHYQQLYDSVDLTLTAYNRGPSQVNDLIASGQNPANGYSAKVLGLRQRLREIDASAQP